MDLDIRQSGGVCVLKLKGGLKYGEAVTLFEKSVDSALGEGFFNFVLNLEAMPVIDSCGIGALVNVLRKAKKSGGDARLVNPSPFATKTLKMCGIYDLFSVYDSETAAAAQWS